MLDHKYIYITAKYQNETIASSTCRIYSCHFAGSTHFYFTKAKTITWNFLLDHKYKYITAKHQNETIASSSFRIYSCHFAGSTHFYFLKAGGKDGFGVCELTGTPIDIMHPYCASFYKKNAHPHTRTEDFFFFFFSQYEKLSSPYHLYLLLAIEREA